MQGVAAYPALRVRSAPPLPVAQLIVGKPVEEAAALLPRLFNLCREAQGTAAGAAFGLPPNPDWAEGLRREIIREHVVKLCLRWPGLLSMPSLALPRDWQSGGPDLRAALFGVAGRMPRTPAEFRTFLAVPHGVAPVLSAIAQLFAPAEACRPVLDHATTDSVFHPGAQENSVAARQAGHPVLRGIETDLGRGPLWSAVAVAYDLEACLNGDLAPAYLGPGRAVVPAARGYYGVSARIEAGRVAAFDRITPTDHLLAEGGALQHALATLPTHRAAALGPLLLAILDPCTPVSLEPAQKREPAHA